LVVVINFPKVIKKTEFCQRRPNMPILPIFGGQVQIFWSFYPQSSKIKTDELSLLFVMIFKTWLWYNQSGLGA